MPKPKQVTLDEMRLWTPTPDDFSYGGFLIIAEDCSKVIQKYSNNPNAWYSPENMLFSEMVYVLLSLREKFDINKKQFNDFLNNDFGSVSNVLKNPKGLETMLQNYGMSGKKFDSIYSAAKEWTSLDILTKMREDKDKKFGSKLRVELMEQIHGVGFKFASLFLRMCGYIDIAPPDTWGINYVESRGFIYKRSDSGLTLAQGIAYEKILKRHAKKYNVSPAVFQATIYARWSTWKMDSGVDPQYR